MSRAVCNAHPAPSPHHRAFAGGNLPPARRVSHLLKEVMDYFGITADRAVLITIIVLLRLSQMDFELHILAHHSLFSPDKQSTHQSAPARLQRRWQHAAGISGQAPIPSAFTSRIRRGESLGFRCAHKVVPHLRAVLIFLPFSKLFLRSLFTTLFVHLLDFKPSILWRKQNP